MMLTRSSNRLHRRTAFTLIELMIVIVIIAILVGLLLPAVSSARLRVRQTQVRTEISQLENAVGAFKNRFGIEPPSQITLYETATTGWSTDPNSRSLIRQMWPQFNFDLAHDLDGDGTSNGPFTLTQGECLVFFLGGMPNPSVMNGATVFSVSGFSKNPANPFTRGGTREGPFFEFQSSRFSDLGMVGFPEYKDSFPGQSNPYLYFSSYDGSGYREYLTGVVPYDFAPTVTNPPVPILAYRQGAAMPAATPFKSKSFQIISPGQDFKYGVGGPYAPGTPDPLPGWTANTTTVLGWAGSAVSVATTDRDVERDNITNFSNGVLVP